MPTGMKLPHWAQLALALAVVVITWVMNANASGQLVLPALLVTILTIAKTAIGMLTDSVPTAMAAARRAAGRTLSVGLVLIGLGALTEEETGCSAAQKSAAVVDGGALAACILGSVSSDIAAGKCSGANWPICVQDAAVKCGSDVATVATIWAAHTKAEVLEAGGDAGR